MKNRIMEFRGKYAKNKKREGDQWHHLGPAAGPSGRVAPTRFLLLLGWVLSSSWEQYYDTWLELTTQCVQLRQILSVCWIDIWYPIRTKNEKIAFWVFIWFSRIKWSIFRFIWKPGNLTLETWKPGILTAFKNERPRNINTTPGTLVYIIHNYFYLFDFGTLILGLNRHCVIVSFLLIA